MAKFSPLMAIPPLVFAGLAGVFLWGMTGRSDPEHLPSTLVGREAPAIPETTLPGKTQLTADLLKQPGVKIVNFWASWCPPCRAEHPTLTELSKTIPVYGVDLKDPEAAATAFLNDHGDPFHALATDPRGRTAIDWGVTAPPETFIIDGSGKILYRHAGPLVHDDLEKRFMPQLDKALAAGD
ncbi:DsbE family thiol:disulfide interchange protein [Paracoccus aminophilus]|uniref:Cytochrome c biogenesis protein CcmG n=1 Tax=Paracoccus aminophilus JCM 7686 TaxID=1367847 RepID=S5XLJ6_PARAH|nr:DsbE family thiol:disulfide interchange protein [Paracoccus aminophilus]AGT08069.1 cytochrome c biogenesis protein CcmG [Paracoccus aminophilus JCM 7686]